MQPLRVWPVWSEPRARSWREAGDGAKLGEPGDLTIKHVDESWKDPALDLVVGEEFELDLAENPTTGYRWRLEDAPSGLSLESDDFDAGGATGGGGRRRWRFRATGEGVARLELMNARSWEKTGARTFSLTVRVSR